MATYLYAKLLEGEGGKFFAYMWKIMQDPEQQDSSS